jgi:hypothetical protein
MPKAGIQEKGNASSFDLWFERELADVKRRLALLEASLTPDSEAGPPVPDRQRTPRRPAHAVEPPVAAAEPPEADSAKALPGGEIISSAHTVATPAPAASIPSVSPWPDGTDLSDPKNFGLRPPVADLDRGTSTADGYRQRMARHIGLATRVLHTSGVRAEVWREWRAFEKAAQARLREIQTRVDDNWD